MCTELEVTLQGQLRTGAERDELLTKWDELSNYQIGMMDIFWFIAFSSAEIRIENIFVIF